MQPVINPFTAVARHLTMHKGVSERALPRCYLAYGGRAQLSKQALVLWHGFVHAGKQYARMKGRLEPMRSIFSCMMLSVEPKINYYMVVESWKFEPRMTRQ